MATTIQFVTADGNNLTVEDAEPRIWPSMTLHHEYTTKECVEYKVSVRIPRTLTSFTQRLTIRLSQTSTAVTCALEE